MTWQQGSPEARLERLSSETGLIRKAFSDIGKKSYDLIQAGEVPEHENPLKCHIISYVWMEQAKAFLLLWRDVIFQHKKALILQMDGLVSDEALERLSEGSKNILLEASAELAGFIDQEADRIHRTRLGANRTIKQWRLQKNPWPVYEKQLTATEEQCRQLFNHYLELKKASGVFDQIRQLTRSTVLSCQLEMGTIEQLDSQATAIVKEHDKQPGKIAAAIEGVESRIGFVHHLNIFTKELNRKINELPARLQVATETEEGMVAMIDFPLKKRTQQWIESEITPLMYEVWELTESTINGMRMALVNIRNRAALLTAEPRDLAKTLELPGVDFLQPLRFFASSYTRSDASLSELSSLMDQRLNDTFFMAGLYQAGNSFLPVPIQSTIQQFSFHESKWASKIRQWMTTRTQAIRHWRRTLEQEETLSVAEKIARYIQRREGDPENGHYTSIFVTKGYIGESFAVGRQQELEHFETLVNNWKQGYRGAVCLTGMRFSGKSLFGELASNRFFPGNIVRLAPAETLKLQGRSQELTFDLAEALEFVRKYTLSSHSLVWIDDLERWWEPGIPLGRNIRVLMDFIDDHADNTFFMVSMSNWLKRHFDTFFDFGKVFQAEINLDKMPVEEIRKAILIRHGATHKKLTNDSLEEVTPKDFNKVTAAIFRAAEGNVGEALNFWSCSIWRLDDEHVVNRFSIKYSVPDFLDAESASLLASIMMQKRTNEYRLRKLFGPSFSERYASVLQRLTNMGVLRRQLDGWLEINDLLVNDIGNLLEEKDFLPATSQRQQLI